MGRRRVNKRIPIQSQTMASYFNNVLHNVCICLYVIRSRSLLDFPQSRCAKPSVWSLAHGRKRKRIESCAKSQTCERLFEMIGRGRISVSGAVDLTNCLLEDGMLHDAVQNFASLGSNAKHLSNTERDFHTWIRDLFGFRLKPYYVSMNLQAAQLKWILDKYFSFQKNTIPILVFAYWLLFWMVAEAHLIKSRCELLCLGVRWTSHNRQSRHRLTAFAQRDAEYHAFSHMRSSTACRSILLLSNHYWLGTYHLRPSKDSGSIANS